MELSRVSLFKLVWSAPLIPETIAGEARVPRLPGEHAMRTTGGKALKAEWHQATKAL